jgi:hypothetical protein
MCRPAADDNRFPQAWGRSVSSIAVCLTRSYRPAIHADGVNAGVGTAAAGHFVEGFEHIYLRIVERFRAAFIVSHTQSFGETVDRNHPFRTERVRTLNGTLAHSSTPR